MWYNKNTKLNTSNPNINLIKVEIPNDLVASIVAFPQSKLTANGNMFVFGDLVAPRVRGEFDIWNMSIPELMLTMEKATSKFESKDLDIEIKNLVANGSDFNVLIDADLGLKNLDCILGLENRVIFDIEDVGFAIVETNGQLTVYPKFESQPITPKAVADPKSGTPAIFTVPIS